MIKEIKKLKNFGIYTEFYWNELPGFEKFNLIYGWNRSGKTTLSRVFSSCEKNKLIGKDVSSKKMEFEICLKNGLSIKSSEIGNCNLPIRVFNQDFIDDNISFELDKYSNGIVYVSKEDIEIKKKLSDLEENINSAQINYNDAMAMKSHTEKVKNTFLTGLGREISSSLFDKTYNKLNVQSRIDKFGIESFFGNIVSEKEWIILEEITKRKIGNKINEVKKIEVKFLMFSSLNDIAEHAKRLLNKRVVSQTLERLKDDEELNEWVQKGYDLHKSHEEYEQCLFCKKDLGNNFLASLSRHFSKDYVELQKDIEFFNELSSQFKYNEVSVENNNLYSELIEEYKVRAEALNLLTSQLKSWFTQTESLLEEKHKNPFDDDLIEMFTEPEDFENLINEEIDRINEVIKKHNTKVDNHSNNVNDAKRKLELHLIATAIKEEDFKTINTDFENSEIRVKERLEKLSESKAEFEKLQKVTSQITGALEKINKHLKDFFGKEEIALNLDSSKKGYVINRYGQLAHNLSEGEKTAIAFSYFIAKVEEKDFLIEEGIIFIDDPISSFDSNFIYHGFSLIQEHFKNAGQLLISTHNFHFFNLVKDWFVSKNRKVHEENRVLLKDSKPPKPNSAEFYMVENFIKDGKREARIIALDNTLRKFKSEYHFLFNRLQTFLKSSSDYADLYSIGNIARRYFEIYADFKIPNTSNQKHKIEALVKVANRTETVINPSECGKVYKLINEFSHNFNPTSSIEHTDRSECVKAVEILLKIVEYSDYQHFKILKKGYN